LTRFYYSDATGNDIKALSNAGFSVDEHLVTAAKHQPICAKELKKPR
jgi:hypothetical protein